MKAMAADWFCEILGNELGPLTPKQLRTLVEKGRLSPDDRVRQGTEGAWVPAGRVKGLFPAADAAPGNDSQASRPVKAVAEPRGDSKSPAKNAGKRAAKPSTGSNSKAPPVRAAAVADVPQARAAAQPPSRPPVPPPVAQPAPDATASGSAVPPAGVAPGINIVTDAATPTAHSGGRAPAPTGPRKRSKQNAVVVSLVVLVVALAGAGIALMAMSGGNGDVPEEQAAAPGQKNPEKPGGGEEDLDNLDVDPARPNTDEGSGASPIAAPSGDGPDPSNYLDASKMSATRGPVKVRVTSAVEGYPEFRAKVKGFEPRKCLMLGLRLENTDPKLKLDYTSWNLRQVGARGMKLRDGANQLYDLEDFDRSIPAGPLRREVSILSDEPAEDILIFRRPPPAVEKLFLDLPLGAFSPQSPFEGQEEIRLLIPREMITAAPDTPEPEGPGPEQPVGPEVPLPGPGEDTDRPIRTGHPDLDAINDDSLPGGDVRRPKDDPFDEIQKPIPEDSPKKPGEERPTREPPERREPSIFDDNPELRGDPNERPGPGFEEILRERPAPGGPRDNPRGRGREGPGPRHGPRLEGHRQGQPIQGNPMMQGRPMEGNRMMQGQPMHGNPMMQGQPNPWGMRGGVVDPRFQNGWLPNQWVPAQAVPRR
jgi:hypothetical protein